MGSRPPWSLSRVSMPIQSSAHKMEHSISSQQRRHAGERRHAAFRPALPLVGKAEAVLEICLVPVPVVEDDVGHGELEELCNAAAMRRVRGEGGG